MVDIHKLLESCHSLSLQNIMQCKVMFSSTLPFPALRGLQYILNKYYKNKCSQLSIHWESGTNLWIGLTTVTVLSQTWTFETCEWPSCLSYVSKIWSNGHCHHVSLGSSTNMMPPPFRSSTTLVHLGWIFCVGEFYLSTWATLERFLNLALPLLWVESWYQHPPVQNAHPVIPTKMIGWQHIIFNICCLIGEWSTTK